MTYIETPSLIDTNKVHQEIISKPGDVVIDELYITTNQKNTSIKNFSPRFVLYEDMFSNFLSGEITITDAGELVRLLNFNGTEYLTISFRTPQSQISIKKTFAIYALKDRFLSSTNREETYVLLFTSIENITNNIIHLSKKFSGKTDELVKKVFETYLKIPRFVDGDQVSGITSLVLADTPHRTSTTFISTYWTPVRILNWLASRTIGKEYKAPNTLFFETNKMFVFSSIENLIMTQLKNKDIFGTYIYSPTGKAAFDMTKTNYTLSDISRQYMLVKNIAPFTYFDLLQSQNNGMYKNHLYTHDILLKECRRFSYNHFKGYDDFYFMEDYKSSGDQIVQSKEKNTRPFSANTLASDTNVVQFKSKQYKMFEEQVDPQYQTWVPQRTSLLMQMSNFKLHITVSGRSDLEVGRLIYFVYPQAHSGDDAEFKADQKLTGIYMITAIKHIVSPSGYDCILEITKDSFFEAL